MWLGTKAYLLHYIKTDDTDSQPAPVIDAVFLDGAAVVQMLNPGTLSRTMNIVSLSSTQNPSLRNELSWYDFYIPGSLKGTSWQKRGKGIESESKRWNDFLFVDENKTELFGFLSQRPSGWWKISLRNARKMVLCAPARSEPHSTIFSQGSRHMLASDDIQKCWKKVNIRTESIIVLTLAIFIRGTNFRYTGVNEEAWSKYQFSSHHLAISLIWPLFLLIHSGKNITDNRLAKNPQIKLLFFKTAKYKTIVCT